MRSALFVDSWGWIVLANQNEDLFLAVRDLYQREVREGHQMVTSDYVLDEVLTFLFAKAPPALASKYAKELFSSIHLGHVQLERIHPERFEKAWKMRLKYQDHPKISFTDFTSFVVMQEMSVKRVLTNDDHFQQINLGFQKIP